jgi:UDP-N-acetylmuramoylalanine--D-glutamate ligase
MKDWQGQKVVIIGAARQGTALARYLARHGAQVTLTDQRPQSQLQTAAADLADWPITWACGGHPLSLLDDCDLLCPSGGVPLDIPLVMEAQRRGVPLSNDSQIFLEAAPCRTIGITGSAGKTTTTTLVGLIAAESCKLEVSSNLQPPTSNLPSRSFVGGNIGIPLVSMVDELTPGDLAILELSSFQLEIMTRSPNVAAILNITPNHLDRHGTMAAYTAAKARILEFQAPADIAVLGRDAPGAWGLAGETRGRLFSFGWQQPPAAQVGAYLRGEMLCLWNGQSEVDLFPRSAIRLRGDHNVLNVLAACAISAAAGLPVEAMRVGVEGFTGVAHRLEFVRRYRGADWYNNSIATAPERVMATVRSFDEPLVLLVGGRDKHLPWDEFAALAQERVDHIILFGEMADLVEKALTRGNTRRRFTLKRVGGLQEAVQAAAELVEPGDVVLLSPGGTSFDEFRDFEARGEAFCQWVRALP